VGSRSKCRADKLDRQKERSEGEREIVMQPFGLIMARDLEAKIDSEFHGRQWLLPVIKLARYRICLV